jgi:hypothetical protein
VSDDNGEARAKMQRWVAKIKTLPGIAVKAAPLVADQLHANILENFAAQRGPDGTPWKPAKDGRFMFESGPAHLQTKARGTVIESKLKSRNLFRHHAGIARGKIARPMLPTKTIPTPVSDAIKTVLSDHFHKHFADD